MTYEALPLVHGILVVLLLLGRCCHGAEADTALNSTPITINITTGTITQAPETTALSVTEESISTRTSPAEVSTSRGDGQNTNHSESSPQNKTTAQTISTSTLARTSAPPEQTSAITTASPSPISTHVGTPQTPSPSATPSTELKNDTSLESPTQPPESTTPRSEKTSPNTTKPPERTITDASASNSTSREQKTATPTMTTPKRRVVDDTDDVVMKSTPTVRRLMLVLRGNCSHDNLKTDIEHAFQNLSPIENISVTEIQCSTLLDVNVTLKAGELELKQLLRNLSLARNLLVGSSSGRHFQLADFSVKEQVSTDGARSVRPRWKPTREELIIYIAVAVLFVIVLVIAFVVCSIRCCRRQPSKTLDFLETPRLNLRLEDYTLTRIPRPHTVYADHLRTPDQELGVVQAFDTCVVPLEDVAVRDPQPRRQEGWKSQQLRTFGRTKNSPSSGRLVVRRTVPPEDDDEEEYRESLKNGRVLSTSTERLARRDSGGWKQGVDNPIYFGDRRKSKG
uniref:Putative lpxtg-motif cell wall anchor domain protein n=1 Tax=Ixodes ricinus TaxID=34613 RepID=A0A6B0VDQ0_IXORI